MAGNRTIDIKINYVIDTSGLKQAQTATQQAQKATDDLRQSAAQSGANSSAAYKQTAQSIQDLAAKLAVLKQRIIESNDPNKVRQLSEQYKALKTQLDQDTQAALGLGKALKGTTDQTQSLGTQFGNLVQSVRLFLAAGLVREVVSAELEMAKLAGNVQGVKIAFDKLPNSITLLDNLKQKTHGTVSEFDLMKKAVFAADFGIPVKNLGTLLEFAAARAQQTGLNVDYLVDSIVRGIGQKSILRLDNLGLSAERLKNELGGASLKAKSIGEVTEAVTKIANEELQKMGGYVTTDATKVDQLNATFQKLKATLSEKLSSGGFIDFLNRGIEGFRLLLIGENERQKEANHNQAITDANFVKNQINNNAELKTQEEKNDALQQEINSRVGLIGKYNDMIAHQKEENKLIEDQAKGRQYLTTQQQKELDLGRQRLKSFQVTKAVIQETNKILIQYIESLKQADAEKTPDTLEELESRVKALNEEIQKTDNISTKAGQNEARRLKFERDGLQNRIDSIKETIFWEEELDRRRKSKSIVKDVTEIDPEKIKNTITPLATQGKVINDLTTNSQYLFEAMGRIEAGFDGILNGSIKLKQAGKQFIDLRSDIEKAIATNKQLIEDTGINIVQDQLNSIVQSESDSYRVRIQNLNTFYDNQIKLAGNNQRAQSELEIQRNAQVTKLERDQFYKDKQVKKLQAIINGAAAAARAFVDYEYPASLVIAALAAAEVASQVAIIDRQQPGFAKGVIDLKGPGTKTSDSIPARLSKGESVMTADETFRARGVLEMVRANRLDDSILKDLKLSQGGVKYVGMSDERIVSAIQSNRQPDIVRIANDLYEVKKSKDGISKTVKRKSIRNG